MALADGFSNPTQAEYLVDGSLKNSTPAQVERSLKKWRRVSLHGRLFRHSTSRSKSNSFVIYSDRLAQQANDAMSSNLIATVIPKVVCDDLQGVHVSTGVSQQTMRCKWWTGDIDLIKTRS
ncbi:hypothetical protein TNCV_3736841 [Trichonephila clavipes]|nr:hypothetical protein TNCV_3736841 [Trichonephila clavipes]